MNPSFRALSLAAVLTAGLAGCGGSSSAGASPAIWTGTFCKGLAGLAPDEKAFTDHFGLTTQQLASDIPTVKQDFSMGLDKLRGDFAGTAVALQKQGAPAVANGAKIQTNILDALTKSAKIFADAKTKVDALSTSPKDFAAGLTDLGTTITNGTSGLSAAFDSLDKLDKSGKLSKAGDANKDCQSLNG